jgi:C-terminal processing protease CtpA/Prc
MLDVDGVATWPGFSPPATQFHVLLDYNIGLINPSVLGDVHSAMESFADTDGIIIDLRQRPSGLFFLEMRQYLMDEPLPFAYMSDPSQTHPGARFDFPMNQALPQRHPYAFVYDRPVVLLMDEQTFSHPEWVIMSFRVAPNVTVMGPYSMGSNGNIASLPLPGGIYMIFTGLGVYTPERGQTHRIGLTPDIRVDRTIQGIAEGRDELIEAAVAWINHIE